MRPWTPELLAAFPRGASVLPTRPWWTVEGCAITRLDGRVVMLNPSRSNVESPDNAQIARLRTSLEESAQALDVRHPLSHPGYRVGQVWADENGQSAIIQALGRFDSPLVLAEYFSEAVKTHLLRYDPLNKQRFSFLVSDPCCPDRAPWSEFAAVP